MIEYQSVIIRLGGKVLEDEATLTDELNDRSRGGWEVVQLLALSERRVVAVFRREG